MIISDISLREFLNLDEETKQDYNFYIRYSLTLNKSVDCLKIGDMTEKPFGLIKDLQFDFSSGITWEQLITYIARITGKGQKEVVDFSLFDVCQAKRYIMEEIERISELEHNTLSYMPTDKEIRAGIEKLDPLGSYMQFRSIARALNMTIEQVKTMRYDEAFLELYAQKLLNEYEANYQKIISEK